MVTVRKLPGRDERVHVPWRCAFSCIPLHAVMQQCAHLLLGPQVRCVAVGQLTWHDEAAVEPGMGAGGGGGGESGSAREKVRAKKGERGRPRWTKGPGISSRTVTNTDCPLFHWEPPAVLHACGSLRAVCQRRPTLIPLRPWQPRASPPSPGLGGIRHCTSTYTPHPCTPDHYPGQLPPPVLTWSRRVRPSLRPPAS